MFIKKPYFILLASLIITGLVGCGGGGGAASLDVSTNSSGAQLEAIEITPTNPIIAVNTDIQFIATGIYSDNTTKDLTAEVEWSSSAVDAADVSSGTQVAQFTGFSSSSADNSSTLLSPGHTIGYAYGKAKITGQKGNVSGSTIVTVTSATLVSIAITPSNPTIVKGTNRQLVATGTFSDSTTQDITTTVIWNSSDTAVATISNSAGSNGLATSVDAGSTTITATSGSVSSAETLTVNSSTLVSISVSPINPSIALGTTRQFTATGNYSDGTTQNLTTSATWNSSSTYVAAISNSAGSNGLATPAALGSTTIRATSGSISGTTTLSVTGATLVSIAITPTNASIVKGTTLQFIATGTYSDNSTQILTTAATWSSSNAAVAAISNATGSKGLATSVGSGSSTITAISGSVSGTAALTVTGAGTATLAWDAPTTNTDGSYLNAATGISLYKIYYGTSPLTYTTTVNVPNPGTSTISKTLNLSPGTYYFTVTAVDSAGQESSYSNEITKNL